MAVNLSPIGNGFQFFNNDGLPLNAGKLYTYQAGSTTPLSTFTDSSGLIANTNPIILGTDGRPPSTIWLTEGFFYKFVLKTSADVTIQTYDNIYGIVSATPPAATPIPSGGIFMWSGSIGSIPAGYVLCNGSNGTPDLRNRFVVGAGSTYVVDATGGSADLDVFSVPFTAEIGGLTALSAPVRLLDTRGSGNKVGKTDGTGTPYELTVAGVSGVPSTGVAAVALNVTVVDGEAPDVGGYATVYPCGTRPDSSNLNFVNGQTVPNAVVAPLSNAGKVCFYVYGKAHLLADVSGYFTAGFTALSAPTRLLDTRGSGNKVGKTDGTGTAYELTVAGSSGLPAAGTLGTVAMNVTVVDGEATDVGGYVTVYPCGTRPNSSNLNFVNGQTVPNAVIASVSNAGKVCFDVYGKAHLLVDVAGYFS